ncbi:MAG: PorT family protein [Bacteroidales bacterium]|nr:PorT family protein [Bacteroidales bacterium]
MKKTILAAILFLFTINAISQSQIGFKVSFLNPNYKITSSPPSSSETFTVDNTLSYSLDYKKMWPGLFNFGMGFEYLSKDARFTADYKSLGADVYRDVNYSLSYLNVKLLPEFVYGEKLRAYFQLGPYMGFLLNSNTSGTRIVTDGTGSVKIIEDGSDSEGFPTIDWGMFVGAGVEYPVSKSIKLGFELQFTRGFAGYAQEDEYIYATKNFTAGLSLIYVFRGYAERINDED